MSHEPSLDDLAESYVRLVLQVGRHDPDYVDAYYGPELLKPGSEEISPERLQEQALSLADRLEQTTVPSSDEMLVLRRRYLLGQARSVSVRLGILRGRKMPFNEESLGLYEAVAPMHPEEYFRRILDRMSDQLPGTGRVADRYDRFKAGFVVPKARLADVFSAAIQEARKRTMARLALPSGESFALEYVEHKPWSGYNWYKGHSHSLIQINTDLPIYIDRAVDLASHEGYPGHHVYNSLLEEHLVRRRGWVEFSVYALFSPQSLIAEGTANYGIAMAFPGEERAAFEGEVLFPLAGLPAGEAGRYYEVHELSLQLAYAGNEAARRYLDGEIGREAAVEWLVAYALMSPERALQRTHFFDKYRSYVINYNLGQDLVKAYIEARTGVPASDELRWKEFSALLSSPRLPSDLRQS